MNSESCPDMGELEDLRRGRLAMADVERLARHLEQCQRCAALLQGLPGEDTLIEAMRVQARAADGAEAELVQGLIDRMKVLGSADSGQAPAADRPAESAQNSLDFLAPPQGSDEIGRLGPYRILKVIGSGGMGVVFQAEDPQLKRAVALKAMKPALAASETARQRFLREAQAIAAIKHDHIVTIYHVAEDRGVPFLAMELLEGESLDRRINREHRLPVAEVVRIGREIAEGLAAAHQRGLIHRDIKPGNIWLETRSQESGVRSQESGVRGQESGVTSQNYRVKILDFGLSQAAGDDVRRAEQGMVVGTPAYMAPEQVRGQTINHRSDLFSLGCVLYRACTGVAPFQGKDTMFVLLSVAMEQPQPPRAIHSDVPAALSDLIMHLLTKDLPDRLDSAEAVVKELGEIERQLQAGAVASPATAPQNVAQSKGATPGRRRRLRIAWAAALLFLIGGGILVTQLVVRMGDKGHDTRSHHMPGAGPTADSDAAKAQPTLPAGTPLSSDALVRSPAGIKGARGWTLETTGHRGAVRVLAYSPDSRWLATLGDDGALRIWEPGTCKLARILLGHAAKVPSYPGNYLGGRTVPYPMLIWSPDSKLLLSAREGESQFRLWDIESGRFLRTFEGCNYVVWSPNGKMLAAGGGFDPVTLLDVETGKTLHTLKQDSNPANLISRVSSGMTWSADSRTILIYNGDLEESWSAESGKLIHSTKVEAPKPEPVNEGPKAPALRPQKSYPTALSPDGKMSVSFAATAGDVKGDWVVEVKATVRDVKTGKEVDTLKVAEARARTGTFYAGPPAPSILACGWLPDGKTLTLVTEEGRIKQFQVGAGAKPRHSVALEGQSGRMYGLAGALLEQAFTQLRMDLAPDGKSLAAGFDNGLVAFWDVESGKRLGSHPGHQYSVAVDSWSTDGSAAAFRVAAGPGGTGYPLLAEVPGIWLHETGDVNLLYPLNAGSGGRSGEAPPHDPLLRALFDLCQSRDGKSSVKALTWSMDGKKLAGILDNRLHVWEVHAAQQVNHWDADFVPVAPGIEPVISWSRDGKSILGCQGTQRLDYAVRRWEVDSGKLVETVSKLHLPGPKPDQALTTPGTRPLSPFGQPRTTALIGGNVNWSGDGKLLATTAEYGSTVEIWEVDSGKQLTVIESKPPNDLQRTMPEVFPARILRVLWSPDGKSIIIGSTDGKLRVYDPRSGRLITEFKGTVQSADKKGSPALLVQPGGRNGPGGMGMGAGFSGIGIPPPAVPVPQLGQPGRINGLSAPGQLPADYMDEFGWVSPLGWLADDKTLVSIAADNRTLCFWSPVGVLKRTSILPGPVTIQPSRGNSLDPFAPRSEGKVSPDLRLYAHSNGGTVRFWDIENQRPLGTLIMLRGDQYIVVNADGNYAGTPGSEKELVCVVQTDAGQETLGPEEFGRKYGWKNDPKGARLMGR